MDWEVLLASCSNLFYPVGGVRVSCVCGRCTTGGVVMGGFRVYLRGVGCRWDVFVAVARRL